MADDVALIALSSWDEDTDETVLAFQKEVGVESIPMGMGVDLYTRFSFDAVPATVIIDRNGICCYAETGSVPDKDLFVRLFSVYTADDYSAPVLLDRLPSVPPTVEQPAEDALAAALGWTGDAITWIPSNDASDWPFVPAADGVGVEAGNSQQKYSQAVLTVDVDAKEGEGLIFDCKTDLAFEGNALYVDVDDKPVMLYKDAADWTTTYIPFDKAGTYRVTFICVNSLYSEAPLYAALRNMKVGTAEEISALDTDIKASRPERLEEGDGAIEIADGEMKSIDFLRESNGELALQASLLTGDTLTLRVRLGKDINDALAYVKINNDVTMLSACEKDELGYLLSFSRDVQAAKAMPGTLVVVCPSVLEDSAPQGIGLFLFFQSEEEVDAYISYFNEMVGSTSPENLLKWQYSDGSPKAEAAAQDSGDEAEPSDGKYVILVTDEDGQGLENAMVQICDELTCRVEKTDAKGRVSLDLTPQEYEIHLLAAPEGYEGDDTVYTLPAEGGTVTFALQKK